MTDTIITIGYAGWALEDLYELCEAVNGILVDVRFAPDASRTPAYNREALEAYFGNRYVWVRELGNRGYHGHAIDLVDFERGAARVRELVEAGYTPILLCGCPNPFACHRRQVAERLACLWGMKVLEIRRIGRAVDPEQLRLFGRPKTGTRAVRVPASKRVVAGGCHRRPARGGNSNDHCT